MEYEGKKMIADTDRGDGGVYFEKEYFEFRPRDLSKKKDIFRIYYKDIISTQIRRGIKSTVFVELKSGYVRFYLYKVNTFVQLVEEGRKQYNVVDVEVEKEEQPLTDAQIEKLEKLNKLHKDGVLSDQEFEKEKGLILNRK